jgi:small GTP-binding protein
MAVGKSSIILRYIDDTFSVNLMNSIGVDFKLKNIEIDKKRIKLQIWDTAGSERFRTITTSYYRGAHAIIMVFDITKKETFDHIINWMADIDKFAKQGVLRILVGNKCDLENQREVNKDEGLAFADKYGIQYFETSAKETINIESLFIDTTKYLLSKQIQKSGNNNNSNNGNAFGIDLNNNNQNPEQNKTQSYFCC